MAVNTHSCSQWKADFFPMMVLALSHADIEAIQQEVNTAIKKAPKQFIHAPIIIDVNAIPNAHNIDIKKICEMLRQQNIFPVGIRGLTEDNHARAIAAGLAILKTNKTVKTTENKKVATSQPTKIVTKPIRAGAHVYAKDGDLIVLSSVNAGAECIADGNIHIYGPLRGRALAGANGDSNARIFCKSLEAELIAIAGHYLVNEDIVIPTPADNLIQIYLENDKLKIVSI